MFCSLRSVAEDLRERCAALRPDEVTPVEAAERIDELAEIVRLAEGATVRLASRIDESVTGAEGEHGAARWLARHTGRTVAAAGDTVADSEALGRVPATAAALTRGELNAAQAHEVTSAAVLDPSAESELLDLARNGSLSELRRAAKKVRAAAKDHDEKAKDAHEHRDLGSTTDEETGEGHLRVKGPADAVARMLALLEPWIQAQFAQARRDGRRERRGALAFDALLAALGFAESARRGDPEHSDPLVPKGPPVKILARLDIPAAVRGHTLPGETCEIDGFGPVPVDVLRQFLPDAAIDVIATNGVDIFNVTRLRRRTNACQQTVLDWFGGRCARLGCRATRRLQVDHRIDWAHTHVTELKALDWLCPEDHRRKTHEGWALVPGRGRRRMVPPDDPAHPANAPPGDPAHPANAPPGDPAHPANAPPGDPAHPANAPLIAEPKQPERTLRDRRPLPRASSAR